MEISQEANILNCTLGRRQKPGIRNLVSLVGMVRARIRHRPPAAHRPRKQPHEIDRYHTECGAHFERPHHSRFRGREPQICGRGDATDKDRYNIPSSCDAKGIQIHCQQRHCFNAQQGYAVKPICSCLQGEIRFAPPVNPARMYRRQAIATEDAQVTTHRSSLVEAPCSQCSTTMRLSH